MATLNNIKSKLIKSWIQYVADSLFELIDVIVFDLLFIHVISIYYGPSI